MKNLVNSKRIIAIVACVLISSVSVLAQTVKKHIVERGETVESIAEKYGVTKASIIEINPDAAQFVYVGMELKVPEGGKVVETTNNVIRTNTDSKFQYNKEQANADADFKRWNPAFEIGYGFLKKTEGSKGSTPFAYFATFGVNYNFTKSLYAGIRAGYNSSTCHGYYNEDGEIITTKDEYHLLSFPIEVGYKLEAIEDKVAFIPFAGMDFNIGLSGKSEVKEGTDKPQKEDIKIGGKVGVGLRAGVRMSLWGFIISGSYVLPLNKKQEGFFGEDSYPEISIGWGF